MSKVNILKSQNRRIRISIGNQKLSKLDISEHKPTIRFYLVQIFPHETEKSIFLKIFLTEEMWKSNSTDKLLIIFSYYEVRIYFFLVILDLWENPGTADGGLSFLFGSGCSVCCFREAVSFWSINKVLGRSVNKILRSITKIHGKTQ